MTDHENKTAVDHALDLLVYAPLGFALDARTLLPQLIDRGRSQLGTQVTMAKMVGQFAVQQGQREAGKQVAKVQQQAATTLTELGLLHEDPAPVAPPVAVKEPSSTPRPRKAASPKPTANASGRGLAIPDYDSLAASQVIPRLEGLSPDELDAVRTYEAGRRGRKTILNKISQLQG